MSNGLEKINRRRTLPFLAVLSVFAIVICIFVAHPGATYAAGPASALQAPPAQSAPTAATDQNNVQGQTQDQNPINGGSTSNQPGANDNTISSGENGSNGGQTGSTSGGNVNGVNTGGAEGSGTWPWVAGGIILALIVVALIVAYMLRNKTLDAATAESTGTNIGDDNR